MSLQAKQAVRSAAHLVSGRFGAQLILLGSAVLIPRALGAEVYGQYIAWMAVIAIVRAATTLGLPMIEVRFLGPLWQTGRRDDAMELASTIWIIKMAVSVLGGAAAASWLLASDNLRVGPALAATLGAVAALNCLAEGASTLYLPLGRVRTLSGFLIARAALTLVAVLVGFWWAGLTGLATGLLWGHIALGTTALALLMRAAPLRPQRFRWSSVRVHLPFAGAVYVGTVAWVVQSQFSIFALANWTSAVQAAFLGLTLQIYGFLQLLFLTAKRAITPLLSQLHEEGQERRLLDWGETMMRYSVAFASVLVIGWTLIGREVIELALGESYLPVYESAAVVLVCVAFYCCAESASILLYIRDRAWLASLHIVVYAILTVTGVVLALSKPSSAAVMNVTWVYALTALIYAASTYLSLGVGSNLWLPLRRTALLGLPSILVGLALIDWDPGFPIRLLLLGLLLVGFAGFALRLGLLPYEEITRIRQRDTGSTQAGKNA